MLDILKKRFQRPQPPQPIEAGTDIDTQPAVAQASAAPSAVRAESALPQEWSRLREPPSERDRCLSALARAWVEGRPPGAAPLALAQAYPRLTNRLALCWGDPKLALRVLDSLLIDKRGGRRGFPLAIDLELRVLQMEASELAARPVKKGKTARSPAPPVPGLELLELEGEPIDPDEDDDGVQWV